MPINRAPTQEPMAPDPPIPPSQPTTSQGPAPPHPRKTTTRRHTTHYDSLSTGRTKDSLLDNPTYPSSMVTRTQAKAHLVKNALIPLGKDPDLQDISLALLNLAEKIPGITATGSEAIRAIAIIVDTHESLHGPRNLPPVPAFHSTKATQTNATDTAHAQVPPHTQPLDYNKLEACLKRVQELTQNLQETSDHNRTSAEILSRVIDDASTNFQRSAESIIESAEELSAVPIALREYTRDLSPLPPTQPNNPSPYRDAVLSSNHPVPTSSKSRRSPTAQRPSYPLEDHAKANTSTKERQILLDISPELDPNHPTITPAVSKEALAKHIQDAFDATYGLEGPPTLIKALTKLRNGGTIVEFANPEVVRWSKNPSARSTLSGKLASNIRIKDRLFSLVLSFVPICVNIENADTLRNIETVNDLPENSIAKIKWIKDPARRSPTQRVAHAFISLSSPQIANQIIREGLCVNHEKLRAHKDRKEPLRCMKCQRWGHFAKDCKHQTDVCGSCAGPHRESKCNSYATFFCVNCQSDHHGSASKECPEFIRRCEELDTKHPDNALPYFPTDDPDSQLALPPKSTLDIVETRPPKDPRQVATKTTQRKLGKSAEGSLNIQQVSPPSTSQQRSYTRQQTTTATTPQRRHSFTLPPTPKIGPPLSPVRLATPVPRTPIFSDTSLPNSPDPPPPPGSFTQQEETHIVA